MWHLLPDPARKRTGPDLLFKALFPLNKRTPVLPPAPLPQLAWCLPRSTHSRNRSSYYDLSCLKAFQQASMVDGKLPLNSVRESLVWLFKSMLEDQQRWDLWKPGCLMLFPCDWRQNPLFSGFLQVACISRFMVSNILHEKHVAVQMGRGGAICPRCLWLFHLCISIL